MITLFNANCLDIPNNSFTHSLTHYNTLKEKKLNGCVRIRGLMAACADALRFFGTYNVHVMPM